MKSLLTVVIKVAIESVFGFCKENVFSCVHSCKKKTFFEIPGGIVKLIVTVYKKIIYTSGIQNSHCYTICRD